MLNTQDSGLAAMCLRPRPGHECVRPRQAPFLLPSRCTSIIWRFFEAPAECFSSSLCRRPASTLMKECCFFFFLPRWRQVSPLMFVSSMQAVKLSCTIQPADSQSCTASRTCVCVCVFLSATLQRPTDPSHPLTNTHSLTRAHHNDFI